MDLITRLRAQETFSFDAFRKADPLMQPAYTWVWNSPLDRAGIICQLDDMLRAGIRCIYILPEPQEFRPCTRIYHMAQEYLSDEFFETVRFAAQEALRRGIALWLYDEGGWPSGGACGRVLRKRPDLCRKTLAVRDIALRSGDTYCPGERALAAFDLSHGQRAMIAPGTAATKDVTLKEYYVHWIDGLNTDPLDRDSGAAFIAGTHEGYARFMGDLFGDQNADGSFIPGTSQIQMMFTDEPGAGRFAWPRGFEDDFRARFGYDILPFLPILLHASDDLYGCPAEGADAQARIDYHQLTGEMFRDNYFVPIHEWCRRNNLLSTGHLDQDHLTHGCLYHHYGSPLTLLREMDVPGVDVIWRQIDLPRPGQKGCPEGNPFFPRFASSAAAQAGSRFAMSESFAVYGGNLTGEEMRYVLNYQLVRGINIFNFMIISCGGESCIPLIFRPTFRPEIPGYAHLSAINDCTARSGYLMQLGMPGADTALYFPVRDIWAGGDVCRQAVQAFDALGQELEARQVDFDVIDDDAIRKARLENGALCIGLAKYRHVIMPQCRYIPEEVRAILNHLDHTAEPVIQCDNPNLRVRTRLLKEGGVLTMLFNESGCKECMTVLLPGDAPLYLLNPDSACVEQVGALSEITLYPGEARYYLRTHLPMGCAREASICGACIANISDFTLRRVRAMAIDADGIHEKTFSEQGTPCSLGAWTDLLGPDFSGEAIYAAQVTLDAPLKPGQAYALSLGHVECSARVMIDGRTLGIVWATPMTLTFDGALLSDKTTFTLEIEVANTMANLCNSLPLSDMFPPDQLSQYHAKISVFEKNAPAGGLYGPICLYPLLKGNNS